MLGTKGREESVRQAVAGLGTAAANGRVRSREIKERILGDRIRLMG